MKRAIFNRGVLLLLIALLVSVLPSCINHAVVVLPPGAGEPVVYNVTDPDSLANAANSATSGDTIAIRNVAVNPDWNRLPLRLNDGVTVTGNISVSSSAASSSAVSALSSADSAPRVADSAVSIFDVASSATVNITDLVVTIDSGVAELVKSVISVDTGKVNVTGLTIRGSNVTAVELGASATAESITGDLTGLTINVSEDNDHAYEIADEIASNTGSSSTVAGQTFNVINTTTNTGYGTFLEAWNEAENGNTIRLSSDVVSGNQYHLIDKSLILDLNGKSMTVTNSLTTGNGLFYIDGGAHLTVNDSSADQTGSIDVTNNETLENIPAVFVVYTNNGQTAQLTINGGTFRGLWYPIAGNGTNTAPESTNITINDGTFLCSDDPALGPLSIYHPQNGTLTINGGTFNGYDTAIEMRAGKLTINDGDFSAQTVPTTFNPNGSGTTTKGAAIAIAQHTTKLPIEVVINGGTFTAYTAINEANPQGNPDVAESVSLTINGGHFQTNNGGTCVVNSVDFTGFIKGGTFSLKPDDEYLAEGYTSTASDEGWIVGEYDGTLIYSEDDFDKVSLTAIAGITGYNDSAANSLSGDIKLMRNIEPEHLLYIAEGDSVNLDLNGHVINSKFTGDAIANFGTLTIDDSTATEDERGTGIVYNSSQAPLFLNGDYQRRHAVRNHGTLTINNGTFGDQNLDLEDENDVNYGSSVWNEGTADIHNGYFTTLDNYGHWEGDAKNGEYSYILNNYGNMTIHNAYIYGKSNGGLAVNAGDITVEDAYVIINGTSSYHTFTMNTDDNDQPMGTFHINGGTFINDDTTNGHIFSTFNGMPSFEVGADREELEVNGYFITGGTFIEDEQAVTI